MDITQALAPKSDQLDAADLMGSPPQVFTVVDVHENGAELADQQPVNIRLAEFPRVWRPSKGMLRVLADNWGKEVAQWAGRQVELYADPEVYVGREKRGGTRIKRLSHISQRKTTLVNPRGGKNAYWSVDPLPQQHPTDPTAQAVDAFARGSITQQQLEAHMGKPRAEWTADDVQELNDLYTSLRNGETTKDAVFGAVDTQPTPTENGGQG